jgi:DNA-binding response OmpR family regulator
MTTRTQYQVLPLWVDLQNKVVWQGEARLKLRPREFAVLCCLIEHAGALSR